MRQTSTVRVKFPRDLKLRVKSAYVDIIDGLTQVDLWGFLGWHDVRQRYRRSSLGPLWITLATVVMVAGMTVLYGGLFKQDLQTFLPLVTTGVVLWGLIAGCIGEGSMAFIAASATIRQIPSSLTVHVFRLIWIQLIYFLHNCIVIPIVYLIAGKWPGSEALFFIPGMILLVLNLSWMTLLLATIGARFRDVPLIVQSMITLLFMMTPVIWRADFLPPERQWVALINPFAHLLEVARGPLIGSVPSLSHWIVVGLMAIGGWIVTMSLYGRSRHRIAYWL